VITNHSDIAKGFVAQLDTVGAKKATQQLAAYILENRIHNQTSEIMDAVQAEVQRVHGIVEATTASVYPLTAELKKRVQDIVAAKTGAKKVVLHEQIDPTVLGGVKINAPDMELDLTLKTKLAKLKA
jgi:F-type H+-transporting ATPase subunit delta